MKRATGRSALVAASVLVGSWLLVLALGISVPLPALRTPIEATLSRTLGQAVSIEGPIAVRPTLGPSIIVQDLRIAARAGGQGVDRLRAGQVAATFGVLSLLLDRPRLERLEARDIVVYLEHADTGAVQLPSGDWPARLELSLHNLVLNYPAGGAKPPLRLAFEQLTGSILPGQPLQLVVGGRLGPFPYVADLSIPPPAVQLRPGVSWPLQLNMALAGAPLQLQGRLVPPADGQGLALELDLTGAAASGPDTAAGPAMEGTLSLNFRDGRPRLDGNLRLARLDLARVAGLVASGAVSAGAALPAPEWLNGVDAGIDVRIADIGNTPVTVRETRVTLALHDGQLNGPLGTRIAGVPFQGDVLLVTRQELPVFALSLAAADIDAAVLLQDLPGFAGVQGKVAHVALHATVPATDRTAGVGGVDAGIHVRGARLSYGNTPGGKPVSAVLDELLLSVPAGAAMTLTAHGALANTPVSVELTGGSLESLLQREAWPVSVTATGGVLLEASGGLTNLRGDRTGTFNLEVSGERLGDLAPWLGVSACAAIPYTARGQLVLAKDIGRLQFLKAQLGGTHLNGELDWSRDELEPLLHAVLLVDTLDPADMDGLLAMMSYGGEAGTASGIRFDLPVLPRPAVIVNADIDLTVARIAHSLVNITGVSFSGRLREGGFQRSPFRARIGSRVLQGQLDISGADTGVAFEIRADDAVPGSVLDRLFSTAVRWVGNAGVVPLRWLFGQGLSEPAAGECRSVDDTVPGSESQ